MDKARLTGESIWVDIFNESDDGRTLLHLKRTFGHIKVWNFFRSLSLYTIFFQSELNVTFLSLSILSEKFFCRCAPFGYLYFFFFFYIILNQNWCRKSILAWLLPHFHLVYWMRFEPTTLRSLVEFVNH